MPLRRSKFGNVKSEYKGILYHSKAEVNYARGLDLRIFAKDIKGWQRQIPIKLVVNGIKICTYNLDFEITHLDDSKELIEVKGHQTAVWKLKKKLFEASYLAQNPNIKYTIIYV